MPHAGSMSEVRPAHRFATVAENFFVDRRWWQFLPAPLTVATLLLYRGPYRFAGGDAAVYALAAVVLASSVLLIALPVRAVRWGPTVLVVMCLSGGLLSVAIPQSWTLALPYLLAAAAARRYQPRAAIWVILAGIGAIVITEATANAHPLGIIASLAILGALTMGAIARRNRAGRLEQMELALAREQAALEEHKKAAALAERARIAREVHDVLAHSLSALSLNLQGARLMLARENASDEAQEQIQRAQRLAVEGLAEARRAVAALREDPVPAARAIADLVTSSRLESGTTTDFTVDGTPRELPGPAEDALYRTAQEALSNTRKHAAGAPVSVVLAYRDDSTELTVTDHQGHRPAGQPTGGYGLTGMRERAELIGGRLCTGPTDDGWQVRLVVPT
jgi:signal transduction histidine kinase